MPTPFPNASIPGIPGSPCCLWQLEKSVSGNRKATLGNSYTCDMGAQTHGTLSLKMTLTSTGLSCDENDNIPDGSVWEAKGNFIRRKDGFAIFNGEFTITSPTAKILYKGQVETTDRLGSHHVTTSCEACKPEAHFEGWFVGSGVEYPYTSYSIRGLIVARGTAPSPAQTNTTLTGSLSGTYIKCP
jgi:hypothetical protein